VVISSTRKKHIFTPEHIENIRKANIKARNNPNGSRIDVALSKNFHAGDNIKATLGNKLEVFFTHLNCVILYNHNHDEEFGISSAIKTLGRKLEIDLKCKSVELREFFTQYAKDLVVLDSKYPYPGRVELITMENYGNRSKVMNEFKSLRIKALKEVLG